MAKYLIIGASSGIGQSLCDLLRKNGDEIITTTRNNDFIAPTYILDASDFDAVEEVIKDIGAIDGIVNCAGSLLLKPAHLTDFEQYQNVISASLTTSFAITRAAGKYLKNASIVFISSAAANTGLANHEAIAAAKAGINGLVKSAAATYASANLRFNAIAPGLVETPLTNALTNSETARKYSENMHALGRIGQADEIARAIFFLLEPQNSWITGQIWGVDGGLANVRPKARA